MPDSFFASSKSRKRKRPSTNTPRQNGLNKKPAKRAKVDEELQESSEEWGGVDDMDLRPEQVDPGESGDEDQDETPAEKRLRLAQIYLDTVKESLADGEYDAAEIDKELVSLRLKQDILDHSGKVHLFIADTYSSCLASQSISPLPILRTRGHRFSVTSAVASESGKYLLTAGKEGNIIKWDLAYGKKLAVACKSRDVATKTLKAKGKGKAKVLGSSSSTSSHEGHTDEVLALAVSSDGKYVVSGGRDRRLIVWDTESFTRVKTFQGPMNHKDVISALSFRKSTHQLFTASFDRTLKVYDLAPTVMGYVETLFGHQDRVLSIDALRGDNCVSVGGRDKTVRYWKIVEETQLVFRGGGRSKVREVLEGGLGVEDDDEGDGVEVKRKEGGYVEGSLECVAMIDETTFVTGGDSGSISLWSTQKKKPIFTHPLAHGLNEVQSSSAEEGVVRTPRWITSLASLRYSDLFASGSWEGRIRLWKLDAKIKSFGLLGSVDVPGVINSLQLLLPPKSFFDSILNSQTTAASVNNSSSSSSSTAATTSPPSSAAANSNSWLHSTTANKTLATGTGTGMMMMLVVAGTGQEHRFGRWLTVKEGGAVNGACVVALLPSSTSTLPMNGVPPRTL